MSRFLLIRLGALGDIVHAIPVAAALRRAFPSARIDWLVDAKHREILDLVPVIDRRLVWSGGGVGPDLARRGAVSGAIAAIRELRRAAYDIAIDLQGLLKSAVLARASGAARVVGFSIWHLREKTARPFYSDVQDAEAAHVIAKNLRVLRALGIDDEQISFPLADVPSPALDELRARVGADRPFAL